MGTEIVDLDLLGNEILVALLHDLLGVKVDDPAGDDLFLDLSNFELFVQEIPTCQKKYIKVKLRGLLRGLEEWLTLPG